MAQSLAKLTVPCHIFGVGSIHAAISSHVQFSPHRRRKHLKLTKNKIGLNPGIARGSIRTWKVSEAPDKD